MIIETLRQAVSRSYWEEWKSIQCATLMVRAEQGVIDQNEMEMMADLLPQADVVQFHGAKRDLHLDQPRQWQEVVQKFLSQRLGK